MADLGEQLAVPEPQIFLPSNELVASYAEYTETPPDVIKAVLSSAEWAYNAVAGYGKSDYGHPVLPEIVHEENFCIDVTAQMAYRMLQLNKDYQIIPFWRAQQRHNHYPLTFRTPDQPIVIADGTWQQFVGMFAEDKLPPNLPKVLIGTPEEFRQQLIKFGMEKKWILGNSYGAWAMGYPPSEKIPTLSGTPEEIRDKLFKFYDDYTNRYLLE